MNLEDYQPVIGICGYSGSGKTTLVEKLVRALRESGLSVGVVKHDAHGMDLDREGKDTDRFFRAGAAVVGHDPGQAFLRRHPGDDDPLAWATTALLKDNDLVIVEGHKDTPLPKKIWLEGEDGAPPPDAGSPWAACLGRAEDRLTAALDLIGPWLRETVLRRPVRGGILLGGGSLRMGTPKQMLTYQGRTWAERAVAALAGHVEEICLLGGGPVPEPLADLQVLPDIPGRGGPLAGMLAAMRWDPHAAWVFLPCDMPLMEAGALGWLLDQRRPGVWALMPRPDEKGPAQPLGAWYDPRMLPVLEGCRGPHGAAGGGKVARPLLPGPLAGAWRSFNTPEEAAGL